jgi:hypothetical protein
MARLLLEEWKEEAKDLLNRFNFDRLQEFEVKVFTIKATWFEKQQKKRIIGKKKYSKSIFFARA